MARRAEWRQVPYFGPVSAVPKRREGRGTEGLDRGFSVLQAPGTEPRSPLPGPLFLCF